MARSHKQWLFVAPALLLIGGGSWRILNPSLTLADGRIAHPSLIRMEGKLGYHLYAPTWLPESGRPGDETKRGEFRILQDFSDGQERSILILAQERRCTERDRYHQDRFVKRAEGRADVNGTPGYFVTGSSGDRRLFWNKPEMAVIISSTVLTDDQMVKIARSVK